LPDEAAATSEAKGKKYMEAQTFRHFRLVIRLRPSATASARTTVVGTEKSRSWIVFRTAVQKVESVRTFS
jgi:hypothetical protein